MKYGLIDSPGSLYHGREAFRLINEAIKNNTIRDTLIAAVSLIITREVRVPYGLDCLCISFCLTKEGLLHLLQHISFTKLSYF